MNNQGEIHKVTGSLETEEAIIKDKNRFGSTQQSDDVLEGKIR